MTMTTWQNDPFFQYPKTTFASSEGAVELPILYFDNSTLIALFWVDHARACAQVAPGLQAVRFGNGKALVALALYEYRATSIADYREAGVAIAVVPQGVQQPAWPLLSLFRSLDKNPVGFYVVDLPVTTAAACAAGREIWGYPKFVTPIDFSLQGGHFAGAVMDPAGGAPLFTVRGKAGIAVPGPLMDLVLYSPHQGHMLRTLVNTRGGARLGLAGSMALEVSNSAHPMAQRLVALGLQHAKPAFVSYSHALQLRLNAGAALPQ